MKKNVLCLIGLVFFLSAAVSGTTTYQYSGTLGGNLAISMALTVQGSHVTGSYYYEKHKVSIRLEGNVDNAGRAQITEYSERGERTGVFVGTIMAADFNGTWTSADGKRSLPFALSANGRPAPAGISALGSVTLKTVKIDRSKELCKGNQCATLTISYPRVVSGPAGINAPALAQLVQKTIDEEWSAAKQNEFLNNARESSTEDPGLPDQGYNWYLDVTVTPIYNQKGLLVLREQHEEYTGGAHPNHFTKLFNFDATVPRRIALADFLKPGYQQKLDPLVRAELNHREPENSFEHINDNFAITPKGLVFVFDPYEVAPYAAGSFEVTIPWAKISNLLKENGPVKLPL